MSEERSARTATELLLHPIHFFSLGFGTGCAPKAPGTFGTLAAVPVYLLCQNLSLTVYLLLTLVLFVIGIWLCQVTADAMGLHDAPAIVWDEIVGYLITMIAAPPGVIWVVCGFVLFRLFDIWKPWPIRVIDSKVHGGLGIMLDDVLAAVFALICMQLLIYIQ